VHAALQAEADLALREAQGELAGARRKRQETAAAASGLPELAVLKQADQAHDRLGDCNDELGKAEEEAGKARQERDEMSSGLADAESELEAAASHLESMRLAHQAVDLAGKLVVGQPCPVCLYVVESIAEHAVPEDLTKAKAAQVAAQKKVNALREKHTDAASKAAGWVSRFQTLSAERDRVLDQVAAYPAREPLQLLIGEVQAKNDALASARLNEDSWTATCDERQGSANNLVAKAAGFQTSYDSQRDSVAVLGPPEAKHTDLLSDWDSLAGWAAEARVAQDKVGSGAATRAQAHRQAAADLVRELVARCQELDISAEGDVVNVLTALTEASAQAESRVTTINQAINDNKALEEEITKLVEEAEVASALRTLLRADHFPEWLISEALEVLVADASRTLRALTNDAFSLTLGDKEFMIIDHANADEQRSARTLSGGETFQASLALALALSDQIRGLAADGAPRLDALFLDEGFGTLDAETLDTVASTIENLGQSGRMVGIISHVRELAARVPVRFEIRKGPRSATVEKVYA
jgi:exonuclease SbcC